jgi:hypothetical protein
VTVLIGNALLIPGAYAPFSQKTNFKISKKLGKKYSHVYLHILCAHAQFGEKRTFFVGCAKKDKKSVAKRLILVPNFVIFT